VTTQFILLRVQSHVLGITRAVKNTSGGTSKFLGEIKEIPVSHLWSGRLKLKKRRPLTRTASFAACSTRPIGGLAYARTLYDHKNIIFGSNTN